MSFCITIADAKDVSTLLFYPSLPFFLLSFSITKESKELSNSFFSFWLFPFFTCHSLFPIHLSFLHVSLRQERWQINFNSLLFLSNSFPYFSFFSYRQQREILNLTLIFFYCYQSFNSLLPSLFFLFNSSFHPSTSLFSSSFFQLHLKSFHFFSFLFHPFFAFSVF